MTCPERDASEREKGARDAAAPDPRLRFVCISESQDPTTTVTVASDQTLEQRR